ncbi:family 1 glycosylhydrolase [Frondihabitans australicus]|uniref:Glycosyl hydrolase family 1 n=1 Tax=Frondihabitans australicus TaxID=386892 RepID=A0A495IBS2_9MICO|nr:family 1 glycosylhydrolase [Frondihabitans australicus]RKR73444.1 glycosyl hydrolase family 1 [Frondihabitans australicus]
MSATPVGGGRRSDIAGSEAFRAGALTWILGIEDTCVYPPSRFDMSPLDEHALTGHDEHWRDDLDLARSLGATALRYGVDWPLVHTAPGEFDWSRLDERLAYAHEIGLTVIADLVHYGTPTWLDGSFADPGYADAIASFAGAFAARYRGVVDHLTPCNEPITTASFAGLRGVWPPALTGWAGWVSVVLGIADGVVATVDAVRRANPEVVVVQVEASSIFRAGHADLDDHARLLTELGTLPTDLVLGLVDATHPSWAWLLSQGADPSRLAALQARAQELAALAPVIDVLGVNYYPDLSPRTLVQDGPRVAQIATNDWADGLRESLTAFGAKYGLPMIVTETSIEGDDDLRAAWVRDSAREVAELAAEGLDIRGYTWWPLFDFVDWSYASGGRNVEEFEIPASVVAARQAVGPDGTVPKEPYLRRMGIVRLEEGPDGDLRRVPTAAAAEFARAAGASAPMAPRSSVAG